MPFPRRSSALPTWPRIVCALAMSALFAGCFTLDRDADGRIAQPPPQGYEVDYLSCSNGVDDDQDGRTDCQDEDCYSRGHCGEQIPLQRDPHPEASFSFCIDGVDNDDDGQFDCGDRGCQNIRELCCLSEFDDESCSDGIDNDGNGFADCADFSCRNGVFVTVCEAETNCGDRLDNDGDRLTDCNDDDCQNEPMCEERDCDNGEDDDGDELVDCADPSCAGNPACPAESDCGNMVDDNGDGRTDCADISCTMSPACLGEENTVSRCQDMIDNDGNGFTDCEDFSCSMSTDPAVMALCSGGGMETSLAACSDEEDNDNNGFTDCDDFSCSRSMNQEVLDYCAEQAETGLDKCTDGVDNDGNGFVDCDDNACRFANEPAVREACEATLASCTDNIDNNGNGFVDCADFSCRFHSFTAAGLCDDAGGCPNGLACFRGSCLSVISPCQEGSEPGGNFEPVGAPLPDDLTTEERRRIAVAGCTDGRDDDRDGFVDCEDWDCNYNPLVIDEEGNPICRFAGGRTCTQGARAGEACSSDDDCSGLSGACGPPGPRGAVMVCP
ncbi:MAG: hypothetical protein AB8I08_03190 [Sandaracinaceae bacterium]